MTLTQSVSAYGETFELKTGSPYEPKPVLLGVRASGRIEGALLDLTLRQTYRNDSDRVLEVVYTFPLSVGSVVMAFATELNGQRMGGAVVARRDAEARYEDALSKGDAPVMLEALGNGLYTANIGNLKPGDNLTIEVRFSQLLTSEQGCLRLAIPTTIAPRYGNPTKAGLQAQQVPHQSLLAEYPIHLEVVLAGSLAAATVECPSHSIIQTIANKELRISLAPGSSMDRDIILLMTPTPDRRSVWIPSPDVTNPMAPFVRLARLQPSSGVERGSLTVKLLVDCSGSMAGDSIDSARRALRGAVQRLRESDMVSFSRFGSTVENIIEPVGFSQTTKDKLCTTIDATDATLGGTEMEMALRSVFGLRTKSTAADVLLVTDGEIWDAEAMIEAAQASGHRVFAIGVGSAPAEGVLRALAESTGGACEFASPGEQLESAARRMLDRMRQQPWNDVRVDWGSTPVWTDSPPRSVFGADAVLMFAGFQRLAEDGTAVRLLGKDASGREFELARAQSDAACPHDSLSRMAAARRLGESDEGAAQRALDYQLLSPYTHCVLVHERAQEEKALGDAELHRVNSMLAAGWGATASVREAPVLACSMPVGRLFDIDLQSSVEDRVRFSVVDIPPTGAETSGGSIDVHVSSLRELATSVAEHLSSGVEAQELSFHFLTREVHAAVREALEEVVALGLVGDDLAWLLLAMWVTTQADGLPDSSVSTTLFAHAQNLPRPLLESAQRIFERVLGMYSIDEWRTPREHRLLHAMAQPGP